MGGPRWEKGEWAVALQVKDSGAWDRMADAGTYVLVFVLPSCARATGTRVATVERNGQLAGIVWKVGALSLEAIMPDIPDMQ